MAATYWKQSLHLKDSLFNTPYYFEFHQAIKVLERLYPDSNHVGETPYPQNEITFLSARIAYSYAPSDIDKLEYCSSTLQPLRMHVNFFGLAGINGPLPMPFTEQLMRDNQNSHFAMQDFIDVFNHRLLSLFHRIRKKYWIGLKDCSPGNSQIARMLYSLCGLGLESLKNRLRFHDRSLLYYTSIMWQQPASTTGLTMIISNHFDIPTSVQPWQGKWISIDADQRSFLGRLHHQLGRSATLGRCFWDQMRGIQLKLGPLNEQQFTNFLPNGQFYDALKHLTQFYIGIDYDVRYQLNLLNTDIPKLRLGNNAQLGWTTWLPGQSAHYTAAVTI